MTDTKSDYAHHTQYRNTIRDMAVEGFGRKCGSCGVVDSNCIYQFHHLDPKGKDFIISGKLIKWDRICDELDKCAMLCIICHRKHHHRGLQLPSDIKRFDRSTVAYRENELKDECPSCGGPKSILSKTCSTKCSYSSKGVPANKRIKVDWDAIDIEAALVQYGNVAGLAKHLGVSVAAVYKRMKKLKIGKYKDFT